MGAMFGTLALAPSPLHSFSWHPHSHEARVSPPSLPAVRDRFRNSASDVGVQQSGARRGNTVDRPSTSDLNYTNALPAGRLAPDRRLQFEPISSEKHRMIRLPIAAVLAGALCGLQPARGRKTRRPGFRPRRRRSTVDRQGVGVEGIRSRPIARPTKSSCRAFIDLIGRIPTVEEIYDFELDRSANKRARLISRLLNDSGYKPRDKNGEGSRVGARNQDAKGRH